MKSVSAKELKNQIGTVFKLIQSGQRVLITKRSKPFAVLSPVTDEELESAGLRPYEEAWGDIEKNLHSTTPAFSSVNEAMKWSRRRR